MYAVWSWLEELCELDRALSPEEAIVAFTDAGLEVEGFTRTGDDFSGVVVAQVVGKRPHPESSKLTLVDVITEKGGTRTEVVCGAPNVPEPGGLVLWAPPGAVLPGGITLGKKTIRGVESAGMICAEDELGLGEDHDGIIVIDPARDVLVPRADADPETAGLLGDPDALVRLGIIDATFEIGVHANRPDCLGHRGLARELVALVGGRVLPFMPVLDEFLSPELAAEDLARVTIDDAVGCPRYTARVIDGVSVGASPRWMQQRLRWVGVRPLSSMVDITNYVMFELGQPMHAFDYRHVSGAHIQVRRARAGERMTTLDDVERALVPADLLICDAERPVALAGVMGGANSEVADDTTRILLESASFHPDVVRATARRLGLHSEASHRFERGVDPNLPDLASRRAAELMARLSGGEARIARGVVDAYPTKVEPWRVTMRASRASLLTGVPFTREGAATMLGRLGIPVQNDEADDDRVHVMVPTYRPDLTREVDLIEEVIRIHGMHNVPATLPESTTHRTQVVDDRPERARATLVGAGMTEAIMFGFTSQERIDALGLAADGGDDRLRVVPLANPMTREQAVMRTSLLPNLLGAVARNASFGETQVELFEIGSVFWATEPGALPEEPRFVTGVMTGARPGWLVDEEAYDFFDAKGMVERLLVELLGDRGAAQARFEAVSDVPYMHPGVCAAVYIPTLLGPGQGAHDSPAGARDELRLAGYVGEIHPRTREALGVEAPCFAFDLSLEVFPAKPLAQMREIPRYPAITRDISFFVDQDTPADRVRALIEASQEPLIERVAVLEDYRDPEKVPAGKKGFLWTITYRSSQETLTDEVVDAAHEAIVARLLETLDGQRR